MTLERLLAAIARAFAVAALCASRSRRYSSTKAATKSGCSSRSRSAPNTRLFSLKVLIVRLLSHVPEERAVLHPQRSAPTTVNVPPHSPHLISPDSSRLPGTRRTPAIRFGADSTAATVAHVAASTMRSSGTSCIFHSDSGFGRDTRRRVT